MVAPTTPGRKYDYVRQTPNIYGGSLIQTWEKHTSGTRQRRPYNLPLPASLLDFGVIRSARTGYGPASPSKDVGVAWGDRYSWDNYMSDYQNAYNKAYAKFIDALGGSAGWGENLAQMHQATSLIESKGLALLNFSKRLRRFDIIGAGRALGMSVLPESLDPKKHRREAIAKRITRDFGGAWLEFHFGIEPVIKDIHDSLQILSTDFAPFHAVGKGSSHLHVTTSSKSYYTRTAIAKEGIISVKIGADVRINNPNLYLMNKFGIINPVQLAWNLIPFSFIVDWFVNVGDALSSYTDLIGMEVSNPYFTKFSKSTHVQSNVQSGTAGYDFVDQWATRVVRFERALGLGGGPVLKLKPAKQVSVVRGATAISLLTQFLR